MIQFDVTNPEGHWVRRPHRQPGRCARGSTPRRRRSCASTTQTWSPSAATRRTCETSSSAASSAWTATCGPAHKLGIPERPRLTTETPATVTNTTKEAVNTMARRVNVIGVGMTKFAKPGASEDYHVMASKAARAALEDAKIPYEAIEQAYAGLRLRRQHVRAARRLRGRPHRHPRLQREQQLLDGLDGAHAREAGDRGRAGRVRARARLREDGEGRARLQVRPTARTRWPSTRKVMIDGAGLRAGAAHGADVRRRGPRVPLEVRHQAARPSPRSARRRASTPSNNPLRALQPAPLGRGGPRERGSLRPAHALPVLPAHVRRRGGDRLLGRVREEARAREPGVDRGARR